MTTAEKNAAKLNELITAHRVVRVEMQAEHATCIANHDMPEYGIVEGEQFELFASSYEGYAYIVKTGSEGHECSCPGFVNRRTCKHTKAASQNAVARYYAAKAGSELVLTPVVEAPQFKAKERELPRAKQFANMPLNGQERKVEMPFGRAVFMR